MWLALLLSTSFSMAEETTPSTQVDKVKVGTMGIYNPFSYRDETGKLTGYDIEILREVAKRDPSLEFEFIASAWETLFPGLDSDKFQLLANQIVSNPDRERRYYLTDKSYFNSISQLIVRGDAQGIHSLHDLKGKKVGVSVGDSHARALEDWNAKNGNIINIAYYEGDFTYILQDLQNGRVDGTINEPVMAQEKAATQSLNIKVVGDAITSDPARFIVQKNATGLRIKQKIDRVLSDMIADGTLSAMSIKQFGKDYVQGDM